MRCCRLVGPARRARGGVAGAPSIQSGAASGQRAASRTHRLAHAPLQSSHLGQVLRIRAVQLQPCAAQADTTTVQQAPDPPQAVVRQRRERDANGAQRSATRGWTPRRRPHLLARCLAGGLMQPVRHGLLLYLIEDASDDSRRAGEPAVPLALPPDRSPASYRAYRGRASSTGHGGPPNTALCPPPSSAWPHTAPVHRDAYIGTRT